MLVESKDDEERDSSYVSAHNSYESEDDDGCDKTSLEHEEKQSKPSIVKVTAAVEAQNNALLSPGKAT